tara:strand:+ start:3900 stop:4871 length:972 start_codon:yes stop_codon:yes gene_type:complete
LNNFLNPYYFFTNNNLMYKQKVTRKKCSNFKTRKISCFTTKKLQELRKIWNKANTNNRIRRKDILTTNKKISKKKLWKELSIRLNTEDDSKWKSILSRSDNISIKSINKITEDVFAPKVPYSWDKKPDTWLSTDDIVDILKYFEKKYPKFKFYEPTTRDFAKKNINGNCVLSDLCNCDVNAISEKYDSFGTIFNNDYSYQSGSHWNAFFVNIETKEIMFYDSFGHQPNEEILNLMNNIKNQGKNNNDNYEIMINNKAHQKSSTECGMYSIYFLVRMLSGEKFIDFCNRDIPDKIVYCLRGVFMDDQNGTYKCSLYKNIDNVSK